MIEYKLVYKETDYVSVATQEHTLALFTCAFKAVDFLHKSGIKYSSCNIETAIKTGMWLQKFYEKGSSCLGQRAYRLVEVDRRKVLIDPAPEDLRL